MKFFDVVVVAITSALVAIVAPLFVLSNNVSNFARIDLPFVILIAISLGTGGFSLVCSLLWVSARLGDRAYRLFAYAMYFAAAFLFLSGLVFPLTADAEQVEIHLIRTHIPNLLSVLVIATCLAWLLTSRIRTPVLVGVGAIAVSTVATSVWTAHEKLNSVNSLSLYSLSSNANIFVIGFDGISGPIARGIIRSSPELRKSLEGFSMFENVISSAPATYSSLTSVVYGDTNLEEQFSTMEELVERIDRDRLLPNRLEDAGFQVSSYVFDHWHDNKQNSSTLGALIPPPVASEKITDTVNLYRYTAARMFSPRLTFGPQWAPRIIDRLDQAGAAIERPPDLRERILTHKGVDWDAQNVLSVLEFNAYVRSLSVDTAQPVVHFAHFLHPHFPVDFDEKCSYGSDDIEWFEAHQTRQGVVSETECVIRQLVGFIDKLRELDVLEKSVVILLSDHGIPARIDTWQYTDADSMESFLVRGQPNWGYARYTPLLLTKPFGPSEGGLILDERPAILSDLANTICRAARMSGCDLYPGYDLLAEDGIPEGATYFVNLVENQSATHLLDTHETVRFRRSKDFLVELHDFLTQEIVRQPLGCGSSEIEAARDYNNGKSDYSSWATWKNAGKHYLRLQVPKCPAGRLIIRTDVRAVSASVNGTKTETDESGIGINTRELTDELVTIEIEGAQPVSMEAM